MKCVQVARIELPIGLDSLRAFHDFVARETLQAGLPEPGAGLFDIAALEVFTNIVRHTKGLPDHAMVKVSAYCTAQEFVLEVVHPGEAFTPPKHLPAAELADFPEGGFGLSIIHQACDRVTYTHGHGANTVRLGRNIRP